jgi:hypothetical protein
MCKYMVHEHMYMHVLHVHTDYIYIHTYIHTCTRTYEASSYKIYSSTNVLPYHGVPKQGNNFYILISKKNVTTRLEKLKAFYIIIVCTGTVQHE